MPRISTRCAIRVAIVQAAANAADASADARGDPKRAGRCEPALPQRPYQPAIDAYKKAGTLIYSFLDANTPTDVPGAYDSLSKDVALFGPLLNIGAQYLTLLPTAATEKLKPTIPVDPSKLTTAPIDKIGIRGALLADTAKVANGLSVSSQPAAAETAVRTDALTLAPSALATTPSPVAVPHPAPAPAPVPAPAPAPVAAATRSVGVLVGANVVSVEWSVGSIPAIDKSKPASTPRAKRSRACRTCCCNRISRPTSRSRSRTTTTTSFRSGIAQALQALGDYANAETYYLQAAAYQYINAAVEVPFVWLALANLYLAWGNSLFLNGDAAAATAVYTRWSRSTIRRRRASSTRWRTSRRWRRPRKR